MADKLAKKLAKLPTSPGVYFYRDKDGEIIYIGKAANLRNRVRQYFQKSRNRDPKTEMLISEIVAAEWTEVETEVDALFLEAELVKRYLPRYNILLRDDKSSQYVRIDYKSEYPTVALVRRPLDDGAEYFGPYINGFALKKALRFLRRAFPYAISHPTGQKRPSLHYHLGLDPGLEGGKTSLAEYRANLRKLMQYLRGHRVKLTREIEKDMKRAARGKDFELAAKLRNQLFSLQALSRQILFSDREIQEASSDQALVELAQLLDQYRQPQPSHLDGVQGKGEQRTKEYKVGTPREQAQPLTKQSAKSTGGVGGSADKQDGAMRRLRRIEGFDISHQQGTDTTASMVVFMNGLPYKAAYRKFKMRLPGNDDFAHMAETLSRRLSQINAKKWGLPDLILIDGGKGQLSSAMEARDSAGHPTIPMIGLAKRFEDIIIKDSDGFKIIQLPTNSHLIKLLQRIRDESHRFAVSYHSVLKRQRQTRSLLEEVPGIGPATRKKLIKQFGSARGVAAASQTDLELILGQQKATILANYLKSSRD